jgi:flagellar biosynthesis protein FliQ
VTYNREAILGTALIAVSLVIYFVIIPWQAVGQVKEGEMSLAFFPKAGTILLIILSIIFTAASMRGSHKPQRKSQDPMGTKIKLNVLLVVVSIGLYLVALAYVGFFVATPPLLIVLMVILGARFRDWIVIVATTAVTTFAIYYIFIKTLGLPMP